MEKRGTPHKIHINKSKAINIAENKYSLDQSPNEYEPTQTKKEMNQAKRFMKGNLSYRNHEQLYQSMNNNPITSSKNNSIDSIEKMHDRASSVESS